MDSIENQIFTELCKKKWTTLTSGDKDVISLLKSEWAVFNVVAAMVFKKHLLTLIEKHTCEQNEKKHKYGFSVASDPPENNSEFKTWLSTLIQAVLSKFGKISKSHPSHSLQKRLLDEILD